MTTQNLPLLLAAILSGCVRSPSPAPVPVEDDRSIVFPQFFERDALAVGAQGEPYELDGEMLRAVTIAANDFLPPGNQATPCRNRREAQLYRIIRQQNLIFIYIYENHAYCGRPYPALDSGAKYAISADGRILRRIIDGQEGGPFDPTAPAPGDAGFMGEPGVSPTFDALWNTTVPASPPAPQDGGTGSPPTPSPSPDGGVPQVP